ncbi:hypothetical protein [Streptomyces sp. NPDC051577]|uniref:hypothetical protein n=1 Tax=Streptomyces sp. NPDC051577 TaxID=3155166 RepID=UPI00344ADEE5
MAAADPPRPAPRLIEYTAEEIRRLLHQTVWHVQHDPLVIAAQSLWRRTHQTTAKRIHYARRRQRALILDPPRDF